MQADGTVMLEVGRPDHCVCHGSVSAPSCSCWAITTYPAPQKMPDPDDIIFENKSYSGIQVE